MSQIGQILLKHQDFLLLAVLDTVPTVPVIILSANSGEALALQMIRESAEDYLVKGSIPKKFSRAPSDTL